VIQSGDQFIAGRSCTVAYMPRDADLAFFSIPEACRPTDLAKPRLGDAEIQGDRHLGGDDNAGNSGLILTPQIYQ